MKRRNWYLAGWTIAAASLLSGVAQAEYSTAVLADKPLGYWRFNDSGESAANAGTGGASLNGSYVNGERPAVSSFTLIDGRTVNGLGTGNTVIDLGGSGDDYVTVPESILNDLSEFTMSGWIKPAARTANRIGLFGQNDAVEFGFIAPNQIQLWTPQGGVLNYTVNPQTQIKEDTWVHLAVVADGSNMRLFLNGKPTQAGPSYGSSDFNFNIGGGGVYDNTGNQFTGSVDEIAMFDKALTEAQIKSQVAAAKTAGGNYANSVLAAGPLGYWPLNEASGDVAVNLGTGGAALNGTYTGGERLNSGANDAYPGFGAGNRSFSVAAPDDGFVSVPGSPLSDVPEFTLSGWVKPGEIVDNRVGLFGQNDALEFGFIDPNTIQMWSPLGGFVNFPLNGEVPQDQWVHIAAVGDGDNIMIYVDGELMATGGSPIGAPPTPVDSYGNSDFPFNIGGGGIYDTTGNQFVGQMDEVAMWDIALSDSQILAHFNAALTGGGLRGDFNANGSLDAGDLDLQTAAMGTTNAAFDLDSDGDSDIFDRRTWVNDLKKSYMGDADLDGLFNSSDLVSVFAGGKFETGQDATWSEGDWDGDKKFTSSDFIEAFQGGGYEAGPRAAVSAVPEPATHALVLLGLLAVRRRRS